MTDPDVAGRAAVWALTVALPELMATLPSHLRVLTREELLALSSTDTLGKPTTERIARACRLLSSVAVDNSARSTDVELMLYVRSAVALTLGATEHARAALTGRGGQDAAAMAVHAAEGVADLAARLGVVHGAVLQVAQLGFDTQVPDRSTEVSHHSGKMGAVKPVLTTSHGSLFQGDCLELVSGMDDGAVEVVFADPPFNLGKDYGPGISDSLRDHEYLEWCARWIKECCRIIAPGGAFWLYNLPKWNIELGHILNAAGMTFRHWVAVDIKMLLPIPGRLYPSHYSLLYYTKGKPKHFVRPRIPIPSCRHCGGDIKDYGGHRKKLNPDGLNVSDVWTDIPPVRHAKTKVRGPNALSEKMLERVLTISSDEDDLVFDPFGGSGTTYAVAERMHRRWIGTELGDVSPIVDRLQGRPSTVQMPRRGDAGKGMGRNQDAANSATEERDRLFP